MKEFNLNKNSPAFQEKTKLQIIELCFILLCFNSDQRIDLLAVYRCLKHIELN